MKTLKLRGPLSPNRIPVFVSQDAYNAFMHRLAKMAREIRHQTKVREQRDGDEAFWGSRSEW